MKSLLLTFSLIVLCAANCFAQAKSCDLQLEVIQNQSNSSGEKIKIVDTEAIIINLKGAAKTKAKPVNGMPYFENLDEGNYTATVSGKGYKSTIKRIHLDCASLKDNKFVSQEVWMWSGSSKEKVHFIDSDYNAEIFQKLMVADLALDLPKPDYPKSAMAVRATGAVAVQVTIDEQGNVISAERVSGHPLLALSAVDVAKKAKFVPSVAKGTPVKVTGLIVYNFFRK
jgi:TonB family protein